MARAVALVLACLVAAAVAWPVHYNVQSVVHGDGGEIAWVRGELGRMRGVEAYLEEVGPALGLSGRETWRVARKEMDRAGNAHLFLQEYIRGLEVDGGELGIHYDAQSGHVFAIGAHAVADTEDAHYIQHTYAQARVDPEQAVREHYADVEDLVIVEEPELLFLAHEGDAFLAYRVVLEYTEQGDQHPIRYNAYFSPLSGEHIIAFPLYFPALDRVIYDMQNSDDQSELPGKQVRTEGGPPTGDPEADNAYDNAGVCYNFYKTKFNRDSFDNKGSPMLSSVHFGVDFNNAFWNGSQMVYGDGDGVQFANFSSDLSVVCHELTHAVVQYTAGLRYFRDSGALNEGFADIFGASADIFHHKECIFPQQWQIGYETYLAGEALRFMNNPALDGRSYDFYPTRFTGLADNGGVHSNSGIANLAYVLTVQGGVHPQQKTSNWVQGIGLATAEQVFYSALSHYMMRTTNYPGARVATELAASQLYGDEIAFSLSSAWAAVGVGELPPRPTPPAPPAER